MPTPDDDGDREDRLAPVIPDPRLISTVSMPLGSPSSVPRAQEELQTWLRLRPPGIHMQRSGGRPAPYGFRRARARPRTRRSDGVGDVWILAFPLIGRK